MGDLTVTSEISANSPVVTHAKSEAYRRGLQHATHVAWTTRNTINLDELKNEGFKVVASYLYESGSGQVALEDSTGGILVLALRSPSIDVTTYAESAEHAADLLRVARRLFRTVAVNVETQIKATFWFHGNDGPQSTDRAIDAPSFKELQGNYGTEASAGLDFLLNGKWQPDSNVNGQLLVWHGPPGTGKTYAIRSICREWAQWCRMSYITDPETFLGTANYLMEVLMSEEEGQYDPAREIWTNRRPWNLVVLEDAGELVGKDAKTRTGQGLSRLLNVTDGMVGQGLKVLVLITTNEESGSLHEAINRPGRCLSRINFDKLSGEDARNWLSGRGLDPDVVVGPMTLAELYAVARGEAVKVRKQVGFARA